LFAGSQIRRRDFTPFQGAGGTEFGTGWIAATNVTFDDFLITMVKMDVAERTGDGAHHALHAFVVIDFYSARNQIAGKCIGRTRFLAGGVVALQAEHNRRDHG